VTPPPPPPAQTVVTPPPPEEPPVEEPPIKRIVTREGIQTTIPRHPSKEIRTKTYHTILKQLGLKGK
jgi:hypothetical protein